MPACSLHPPLLPPSPACADVVLKLKDDPATENLPEWQRRAALPANTRYALTSYALSGTYDNHNYYIT